MVYRGLEYEVPQSRLYCLCINVALCSTALQYICRVIRRSSMIMKAHTDYIIFGRPTIGMSFPPWRRHCSKYVIVTKLKHHSLSLQSVCFAPSKRVASVRQDGPVYSTRPVKLCKTLVRRPVIKWPNKNQGSSSMCFQLFCTC